MRFVIRRLFSSVRRLWRQRPAGASLAAHRAQLAASPAAFRGAPAGNIAFSLVRFGVVSLSSRAERGKAATFGSSSHRLVAQAESRQLRGTRRAARVGCVRRALPNPSIKPSPNSKTPGPRYSAGMHFLQRGPGVLLPVPAYVER